MKKIIAISFLLSSFKNFSNPDLAGNKNILFSTTASTLIKAGKPNPLWNKFFLKQANRKKIIAAALAFPLPGGILGLHRIYLGTKPYVPLVYIFTLGGGLFILPIIDFCILLFDKDITRFENNPRVFMWIDNERKSTDKKTEK
jgi:TM2 domain-containing membrane protein YozV